MHTKSDPKQDVTLTLTPECLAKLQEIVGTYPEPVSGVRVKIVGRSSAGFEHVLTVVERGVEPPGDAVLEFEGVRIYVEGENAERISGTTIHYAYKGPQISGLEFDNPHPAFSDPMEQAVQKLLDEYVNPGIASHGGVIRMLGVENDRLYIEMGGGCQGCGMASVTLKQGVEVAIKEAIPQIKEVIDRTDHASGSNPYYQAAKK